MHNSKKEKASIDWTLAAQIRDAWTSGKRSEAAPQERLLVARNRPWVRQCVKFHFPGYVGGNGTPDLLGEIVTEAEWKLILHLRTKREPIRVAASFHTFLDRFVRNCGWTVLRRYAKGRKYSEAASGADHLLKRLHARAVEGWSSSCQRPGYEQDRDRICKVVLSVLDAVKDVDRAVWLLRSFVNISDRDIGRELAIPWQKVRGKYLRVGRRLQAALVSAGINLDE